MIDDPITKLWWMSETSLTSKFEWSTSSLEWPLRISAHCKGENTGKSVFFPSFSPYKAPPHESKKKGVFVRKDLFSGNLIKDHEKTSFRQFRAKQAKEGEKRDFRRREQENRFSRLRGRKKGFFGKNTLFLRPRKIISESPKLRSSTGNLHPFLGSFCPLFWRARKRGFSRVFALWAPKKWNIPLISWFWGFARKDLFSPSFSLFALFLAFRPFSPCFARNPEKAEIVAFWVADPSRREKAVFSREWCGDFQVPEMASQKKIYFFGAFSASWNFTGIDVRSIATCCRE